MDVNNIVGSLMDLNTLIVSQQMVCDDNFVRGLATVYPGAEEMLSNFVQAGIFIRSRDMLSQELKFEVLYMALSWKHAPKVGLWSRKHPQKSGLWKFMGPFLFVNST